MVHDLSPFIWRISGDFGLRWYGFSYLLGFVSAYWLISWFSERQKFGMTKELAADFVTFGAIGTLIGGRLGYCLFYSPDLFLSFDSSFPFWGVLAVNRGGMASHGGMIGLVVACILFAIKHRINQLYLFDLAAITGPVGIFYGRVANFINGELLGRVSDPSFQYGVKFPQDILSWPSEGVVGKLSSLSVVVEKIPAMNREKWLEWCELFRTDSKARDLINNGLVQIIDAIQSGNAAAKEAIGPLLEARHPSQLYAAAGEGIILFIILFLLWMRPKKPGVIGSLFVCLYALVRISDEHFRLPDAHIGYQLLGLTRGQWLSIVMFFVGLVLLIMWSRRDSLPIPGWRLGQSVKIGRAHRK